MSPARRRRRRSAARRDPAARPAPVWLWVLGATALAAALRLWGLADWSFWIDEAHTYRDATLPLAGDSTFWDQDRAYYPLSFLLLRFLIDAGLPAGSEGWLRLPFAVVGIATIPLAWWCGRRLVGEGAAVVAAWLMALMPWHLFWSQNARGYVFVVLTATLATGFAARWAESGRRGDLVRAAVAIGVGALFHPTSWFQAIGLVVFAALRRLPAVPRRVAVLVGVVGLAALLALPVVIEALSPIQGFLRAKTDRSVLHLVVTAGYYFRPLLLVAAVAGFLLLRRRAADRALLLACLAAVPVAVLAVLGGSLAKTTARYAICALPAVVWLAAVAVSGLAVAIAPARAAGVRLVAAFLGLALVVDFAVEDWQYYAARHGDRARWREASAWVADRYPGGPVHVLTVNAPSVAFYLTPEVWRNEGVVEGRFRVPLLADWMVHGKDSDGAVLHEPGWPEHLAWQRAEAARRDAGLVVLVKRPELDEIDADGSLWRALRDGFELAVYLPCWVGPKDESVWGFVPKDS